MSEKKCRIALIIDYIISEYSNMLCDGIRRACELNNAELLIFPVGEMHSLKYAFDYQYLAVTGLIKSENIDGIVFATGTQMHWVNKAEITSYIKSFKPIPVVSISIEIPGVTSILVDSTKAYQELIDNIVDIQKCKKIAVMGARSNSCEIRARTRIIKSILEQKGIPSKNMSFWKANLEYGSTMLELEGQYELTGSFDYDCIISLNDEQAFACVDFCHQHELRVPEDVLVFGFDDIARDAFSTPTMTSINQRISDQGFEAVMAVLKLIAGESIPKVIQIDSKPVFRESTERYPSFSRCMDTELPGQNIENFSATEWYRKKSQIFHITRFYSEMQYDMSYEQLRKRLNNDVKSFGVTAFAVVLYGTPIEMAAPFDYFTMPKKAQVFSAFDYSTGYDSSADPKFKDISFNPNIKILPPDLIKFDSEGVYITALFHNTLQYGYLIFRSGTYDIAIYDLMSKILSTIISQVHSYALVNNEHTKFKQKYNQLDVIANTDELTGLYNRRGLYELGQTTLKFAKAMNQNGLIVYSDMDGLKKINDTFGHESGDRAIIAESIILKGNFRSNDVVARVGGDEFVMICPGLTVEAFDRIKQQIDDDCRIWTETGESPFSLSISMGYIQYPDDKVGYQLTPLLSEADAMLYIEKRKKKSKENN